MSASLRKLGRYELTRRLAKGGMGEIYLARARGAGGFEKRVIIKTILPHLAEEEEFVTKFLDEGRIVVQLTHGNIVPVFDMGEQDGEYFIAMEYVDGLDLREVLKRLHSRGQELAVELALHIASEVCKGLGYAHRKTDPVGQPLAIVHRDVSPSNVLISREGEIKIIDFGIARAAGRLSQTANGRIQGKCCYMSPEQTRGQALDHRSDIFATGVVLYEMLTGQRPFEGRSDLESLELVRRCEFDPPGVLRPEIPDEVDRIIVRALAPTPDERYQDIEDLYVDLQHAIYAVGRAVTSQGLAQALKEVFAAEPEATAAPRNLDEALELELARLGSETSAPALHTGTAPRGPSPGALLSPGQADAIAHAPTASRQLPAPSPTPATRALAPTPTPEPPTPTPPSAPEPDLEDAPADRSPGGAPALPDTHAPPVETQRRRWLGPLLVAVAALLIATFMLPGMRQAELQLESDPPGATIRLDGEELAGRRTPQTLTLEPGDYRIELALDGHQARNFRVQLAPGERVKLQGQDLHLAPELAPDRTFTITTQPERALVTANGEELGEAPVSLTLSQGDVAALSAAYEGCSSAYYTLSYGHQRETVSLSLSCLQERALAELRRPPIDGVPSVRDDAPPTVMGRPRARERTLRLAPAPPEAELFLNGKSLGSGARQIQLTPGTPALIEARAPGFEPLRRQLRAERIHSKELVLNLSPLPQGCLNFRAIYPAHNEIAIDGAWLKGRHMTLRNHPLSVGNHRITVRNPEAGKEEHFTVQVEPGEECAHLVVWDEGR
ncbi:serine/threonine protein kinase [Lujinxingia litoralis]|nr:serine/threonine-protein kinase [Lujinxingia litoralis]